MAKVPKQSPSFFAEDALWWRVFPVTGAKQRTPSRRTADTSLSDQPKRLPGGRRPVLSGLGCYPGSHRRCRGLPPIPNLCRNRTAVPRASHSRTACSENAATAGERWNQTLSHAMFAECGA
jgi:hypothetical protein